MAEIKHSLDPVREALREFEEAVRRSAPKILKSSKVMGRQEVDRARTRVMDAIMELVRTTLREKGVA